MIAVIFDLLSRGWYAVFWKLEKMMLAFTILWAISRRN